MASPAVVAPAGEALVCCFTSAIAGVGGASGSSTFGGGAGGGVLGADMKHISGFLGVQDVLILPLKHFIQEANDSSLPNLDPDISISP